VRSYSNGTSRYKLNAHREIEVYALSGNAGDYSSSDEGRRATNKIDAPDDGPTGSAGNIVVLEAPGAEIAIDGILPPIAVLGPEWTCKRVVLLVDPLSSPSEVADSRDTAEPLASVQAPRDGMRKSHRKGQAFVRYYQGDRQYGVFVSRFESKTSAEANWSNSAGEEKAATVSLSSPIGERFRFSNRDGMHNDLTFLRGKYYITVEGGLDEWEQVKQLARVIDERLIRQTAPAQK